MEKFDIDFSKFSKISKTSIFVSGHRDLTEKEFNFYYLRYLQQSIPTVSGIPVHFYVGDCKGCDEMVINAIYNLIIKGANIYLTICKLKNSFPDQIKKFPVHPNIEVIDKFNSHEDRDTYMTEYTDIDILWVREGKWDSGTAQNYVRRKFHDPIYYKFRGLNKVRYDEF